MNLDYAKIAIEAKKAIDLTGGEYFFGKREAPNSQAIIKYKIIAAMIDVDFVYTQNKDFRSTTKKYIVSALEFDRIGVKPALGDNLSLKEDVKDLSGAITLIKETNPSGKMPVIYEIYTSS